MRTNHKVAYLYDPGVSAARDLEIRELLCRCFPDEQFTRQRFKYELPAHRWLIRSDENRLIAHAALHDKRFGLAQGELRTGGVAEVCVHPDFRGHGLVRVLLASLHTWCREEGIRFSALFGNPGVYQRLGYRPPGNPLRHYDVEAGGWRTGRFEHFLVLPLGDAAWPEGEIDLRGPRF